MEVLRRFETSPSALASQLRAGRCFLARLLRKYFPFLLILLAGLSVVWAVNLATLPPAEFVFNNGTEVKTIDPAKATGVPEGRVINALYEGLLRSCLLYTS